MAKAQKSSEQTGTATNGTRPSGEEIATPTAATSKIFTREAFAEMQNDRDLSPSLATSEEDDGFIALGKPGRSFFTIHHDRTFELTIPVTHDPRKSGKSDPYIVDRAQWGKFPPGLLRIKRILYCMKFEDEALRPFLWLADWFESWETPNELHKSLAKVIARGRQGWGQALFHNGVYTWRRWPETWMGEPPPTLWPDRDFYSLLTDVFADRYISTPDHELIRCIGEE